MSGLEEEDIDVDIGLEGYTDTKPQDGFFDPNGQYPKREYTGVQSTNLEARGIEENNLLYGGGDVDLDLDMKDFPASEYPLNQVRRSVSNHVQEIDDTPGRERILIKHRTGTGIEMMPDGTILINTTRNSIRVTAGDEKVIIEGDGDIVYHGNVKMRVDGNFDLDVGGDYNVNVGGDHSEDIKGGYRQDINKNFQSIINKNVTQQITGSETRLIHRNYSANIKGTTSFVMSNEAEFLSKGIMRHTSEKEAVISAPSINIGAESLLVMGDSGTIGGENIVHYAHTAHIPRINSTSIHATTFHGDLEGTAKEALDANKAGTAALGATSPGGYSTTVASATNKVTVLPTNAVLTDYIDFSEFAARKINLDPGNVLYNQINRLADYGNVSERTLSTTEIRSKLRDVANQQNTKFIGTVIAENSLSATYSNAIPNTVKRIVNNEATARRVRAKQVLGKSIGVEAKRFKGSVLNVTETLSVEAQYDPRLFNIDSRTELQKGIRISKFLGGYGNNVTFDHVATQAERLLIAKQLVPHAQLMREIMLDNDTFEEYRLVVAEGVYRPSATETVTVGGINDLKQKGRAIVYELRDRNGNIAPEKTFDLAVWWKDSVKFEKMILSYDTYNPDKTNTVQIIVIMPEFAFDSYKATYVNLIETRFNNFVQSTNELIECI